MAMRFDHYLQQRGITAVPVDRFDGLEVEVEGPHDWEAFEERPGLRIWVWRNDPYAQTFCANAVLTMHRVPVGLDAAEVFAMLSEEQVQLVPGCHEGRRTAAPADDGLGIQGQLSSYFDSEAGVIESLSSTRIIADDQQTLIAQLTLTALRESPVDWANIQMSVVAEPSPSAAPAAGR